MALHVTFSRDNLNGEGRLKPRVVTRDTVDFDTLLEFMARGTALAEADMRAAVSRFAEGVLFYLGDGNKVSTPLGTFRAKVRAGRREGGSERVEKEKLGIAFLPARGLLNRFRSGTRVVVDEGPRRQLPHIVRVSRAGQPGTAHSFVPGEIIQLKGHRLSFDPGDAGTGVFLVAADRTELRIALYSRSGTARVDFLLEEVPPGGYTLQVRTRPTGRDVWVGAARDPLLVGE